MRCLIKSFGWVEKELSSSGQEETSVARQRSDACLRPGVVLQDAQPLHLCGHQDPQARAAHLRRGLLHHHGGLDLLPFLACLANQT